MTDLRLGLLAARRLGPTSLAAFASYRLGLLTGRTRRRTPMREWEEVPLAQWVRPGFPTDPASLADSWERRDAPRFFPFESPTDSRAAIDEAEDILAGRFRRFGGRPQSLGNPPDWFAFPSPLGDRAPLRVDGHWSEVPLDSPGVDVRLLWELSRFGWVFPLASAYRASGEGRYADGCWSLIDSWRRANPPNRGVHWASGQEVALRILALSCATHVFFPHWRREPERLAALVEMVGASAARIPPTLAYAKAQGNNHLLSEAAGLLTAGLLFPELRGGAAWRDLGRRLLRRGYARQVFADGGYVQHSVNYQRMALELGLWSWSLAELNGAPLDEDTHSALVRLSRALAAMTDPRTGAAPRFGPDDATRVIPLSGENAGDLRPPLEAAARALLHESWYSGGGVEGLATALGLARGRVTRPPEPADQVEAGLYFAGGGESRGMLRCARFRGRPGHSDQLHVDLWWKDLNVALDPGSYLYNGPTPWENALAAGSVHNAPVIDGQEPMRRAGRFLWIGDADGRARTARGEDFEFLEGSHNGYRRLGVALRRTVARRGGSAWVVVDQARGAGEHRMTVGWNLPDLPWQWSAGRLRLRAPHGPIVVAWTGDGVKAGLARAGAHAAGDLPAGALEIWGWQSPRYGELEPCLRLILEVRGEGTLRLSTRFAFGRSEETAGAGSWPEVARLERDLSPRPGAD